MKIGLLGGCLATLNDVSKSELFYYKIKDNFSSSHKISFSLGSYNNISEVKSEIKRLKEKKGIDYLLFQVRPYVYLKNCRVYLKTPLSKKINPLLLRKSNFLELESLDEKLTKPLHERIANYMQNKNNSGIKKLFSFYNFNLLLGYIFGINKSMESYYIEEIKNLSDICLELGIKLIVHGPVMRTSHVMEPILIKSLSKALNDKLTDNITYIDTCERLYNNQSVLFLDGEHVNITGHKMLSDKLIKALEEDDAF